MPPYVAEFSTSDNLQLQSWQELARILGQSRRSRGRTPWAAPVAPADAGDTSLPSPRMTSSPLSSCCLGGGRSEVLRACRVRGPQVTSCACVAVVSPGACQLGYQPIPGLKHSRCEAPAPMQTTELAGGRSVRRCMCRGGAYFAGFCAKQTPGATQSTSGMGLQVCWCLHCCCLSLSQALHRGPTAQAHAICTAASH